METRAARRVTAASVVAVLLVGVSVAVSAPSPGSFLPPLVGGIQVNEPDHAAWVSAVAGAGLNAVQVTLYARQQDWDGPELHWQSSHPAVLSEIRAARAAGLRTVLVMRVALEHGIERNRHLWHGMIWPRDEHLDAWMARYRSFVLTGARMAASEQVDLFVLGNELTSLTSTVSARELPDLYRYWLDPARVAPVHAALVDCAESVRAAGGGADLQHLDGGRYGDLAEMLAAEESVRRSWVKTVVGGDPDQLAGFRERQRRLDAFWRSLVAEVREIYTGAVTYGANFDQYTRVGFWDSLDALAVNAYFPLSYYGVPPNDRRARMAGAWRGVADSLQEAAGGLPVVLLELGWTRRLGATVRPYSYDRVEVLETGPPGSDAPLRCVHWTAQPLAPRERVDALGALADVVAAGEFPALRGVLLWKLTTLPRHRAIEPFALVLGDVERSGAEDRAMLAEASRIADELATGMASLKSGGPFPR